MNIRILFPRLLIVCFALGITATVTAQSSDPQSRQTRTSIDGSGSQRLETDLSAPPIVEVRRARIVGSAVKVPAPAVMPLVLARRFDSDLSSAIQSHLGLPYHYASTGPDSFDCSGFVWRTFQEAGFNFSRGPASSYWATFAAPSTEDRYKFGTLVFFSGLAHVGIVADERGFYHASRHHGVIYSPFNEYWLSRIDGFRRLPVDSMPIPAAKARPRAEKPLTTVSAVEEDNRR